MILQRQHCNALNERVQWQWRLEVAMRGLWSVEGVEG